MNKKSILNNVEDMLKNFIDSIDEQFAYDVTYKLAYDETMGGQWGFRTAGSIFEHRAAEYLESVMIDIGLKDVEKVPVKVDKWQFNSATLKVEGDNKVILPASYPCSGTDLEGITAEIVDVGRGYEADYRDKDIRGKIALVGVDLINDSWINFPYNEAYLNGAIALVTYTIDGFCRFSDDGINVHEASADDLIPCVSISKNDADYLIEQIKQGNATVHLTIDNEITPDKGISYNVIGKIPGKSSDQQIILAGHYDKYFYGFQDDCAAVALTYAIAKAMIDSGYKPQHDIIIVSHGAEEWGAIACRQDWAVGSWRMITEAKPEWAGKTIALFNFELPAFMHYESYGQISSVPEFGSLIKQFISSSDLYAKLELAFKDGVKAEYASTGITEDGISYRFGGGIPYFLNSYAPDGENNSICWLLDRYHTAYDDKDTYSKEMMITNIQLYGALLMYVDNLPAIPIDFSQTVKVLSVQADKDIILKSGADAAAFEESIGMLDEQAGALNDVICALNNKYKNCKDLSEAEACMVQGRALNYELLKAFRFIQDKLMRLAGSFGLAIAHEYHQNNISVLEQIIKACENGVVHDDEGTGIFDLTYMLNGFIECKSLLYSEEAVRMSDNLLFENTHTDSTKMFWGTAKTLSIANTCAALKLVKENAFEDAKLEYTKLLEEEMTRLSVGISEETKAIKELAEMLKSIIKKAHIPDK